MGFEMGLMLFVVATAPPSGFACHLPLRGRDSL
jgi:hypothetical protein